jgi:UDP-N-acetylglucosamine 2-epimerase
MKLAAVVGARPNFVKAAPILAALRVPVLLGER